MKLPSPSAESLSSPAADQVEHDHGESTDAARASPSQLRRAAGGKDTAHLARLVQSGGFTGKQLDSMASHDGKGALHMAAWYGSLGNVVFLLDFGCNIDQIATGPYSYGKTPIFFATTRSRDDVCMLLLQRGANVFIINNKGQSVLSLASTHLQPATIQAIRQAEERQIQNGGQWQNYRESHSDGNTCGDLDPRFVKRPLEPTDIVTEYAINPTSKQSRRGNFARMNPTIAREAIAKKKPPRKKKQPPQATPTHEELQAYKAAWEETLIALETNDTITLGKCLLVIIRFGERRKRPWIPDSAKRLQTILDATENADSIILGLDMSHCDVGSSIREQSLCNKLLHVASPRTSGFTRESDNILQPARTNTSPSTRPNLQQVDEELLRTSLKSVGGVSCDVLQNLDRHATHLSLPNTPVWIDSLEHLSYLKRVLTEQAQEQSPVAVVAMDTEWYTCASDGAVRIATLQLACMTTTGTLVTPKAWVIDVKRTTCDCKMRNKEKNHADDSCSCTHNQEYHLFLIELVKWLFDESGMPILGFAMGHDMSKLTSLVGNGKHLLTRHCIDLQPILAREMADNKPNAHQSGSLPGLKACCGHYFDAGWELSKTQQCSDWSRRPLEAEQIEYAGLDAAVLLVLLAQLQSS